MRVRQINMQGRSWCRSGSTQRTVGAPRRVLARCSVQDSSMERTGVAILGAGFSGLCMAIQLKRAGRNDFVVYEAGEGRLRSPMAACMHAHHPCSAADQGVLPCHRHAAAAPPCAAPAAGASTYAPADPHHALLLAPCHVCASPQLLTWAAHGGTMCTLAAPATCPHTCTPSPLHPPANGPGCTPHSRTSGPT